MKAGWDKGVVYSRPTLTVYALSENKRPVGFARDWPAEPKPKKKRKRKKAAE